MDLRAGDFVELIGPHQTLAQVAANADTILSEILTSFGHRYCRVYVDSADSHSPNTSDAS